jgi:hypothetical protein
MKSPCVCEGFYMRTRTATTYYNYYNVDNSLSSFSINCVNLSSTITFLLLLLTYAIH